MCVFSHPDYIPLISYEVGSSILTTRTLSVLKCSPVFMTNSDDINFQAVVSELRKQVESHRTRGRGCQQLSSRVNLDLNLRELDEQIRQLEENPDRISREDNKNDQHVVSVRLYCVPTSSPLSRITQQD